MRLWAGLLGLCPLLLASKTSDAADVKVRAPLECSRGGGGRTMDATLHLPFSAPTGSIVTVRIDSIPSGRISHFGLHYIYDMATHYVLPAGTTFVEGSGRVVPNTGTENVRGAARIWNDASGIHTLLPTRIENGASYTPPSFEFQLRIDAPAGASFTFAFARYEVMANALIVGNVKTTCTPGSKPYDMARVFVTPRPAAAAAP